MSSKFKNQSNKQPYDTYLLARESVDINQIDTLDWTYIIDTKTYRCSFYVH